MEPDNKKTVPTKTAVILCAVYKSAKDDGTYIYIDNATELDVLPKDLLDRFPKPQKVVTFPLSEDRKLPSADASKVMESIRTKGFYLQLPPPKDAYLNVLSSQNELLPR